MDTSKHKTTLRLPVELQKELKKKAKKIGISLNAYMIMKLTHELKKINQNE